MGIPNYNPKPKKTKPKKPKGHVRERCQACEAGGPSRLCCSCKGVIPKALKLSKSDRRKF